MINTTIRTLLTVLSAATLLFSAAYALDSTEQDFLSFFFDERQVEALQDYQERYTANESKDLIFEDAQRFATDVEQTTLALQDALTRM